MEQGTRFGRLFTPGEAPLPSGDLAVRLYQVASQTLRNAGYNHYEVSSYARPGHRCGASGLQAAGFHTHNLLQHIGRDMVIYMSRLASTRTAHAVSCLNCG